MRRLLIPLLVCFAGVAHADLQPEPLFQYKTLPETYPDHWLMVHDATFFHMLEGRVYVIDADASDMKNLIRGMVNASYIADFHSAATRPEFYVGETFYARGNRGKRTDVVTIYDRATLTPGTEVIIPPRRASTMPGRWMMHLTNDERFLAVFNMAPATSISVIDMVERKFVGEVPIPGCAMAMPSGDTGFTSICGDGTLFTVNLDRAGEVKNTSRTDPFFDIDADALFEKPAMHQRVAFFPTFQGNIVQVNMSGERVRVSQPWSLRAEAESNWRPGGMQLADTDADGALYVLMHSHGAEGTHKDPGEQIWVFDPRSKQRLRRIALNMPALSMAVTPDSTKPLLIATNVEMGLDIYDAKTGEFLRSLPHFGQETPFIVYPQKKAGS